MPFTIRTEAILLALLTFALSIPPPAPHDLAITSSVRSLTHAPVERVKSTKDFQPVVPQPNIPPSSHLTYHKTANDSISRHPETTKAETGKQSSKNIIQMVIHFFKQLVRGTMPQKQRNKAIADFEGEGEDKKTDHAKVKDDDQKEASGKPIAAAKAPAELLVEASKKEGEVHGGRREREMARPMEG
jgi:hypothetical protein